MNDFAERGIMQAVYERLTRLEERGSARDERAGRLEEALEKLDAKLDLVASDVRDAKTGLRVGLWISGIAWPVMAAIGGWVVHHFWPGK